MSRALTWYRYYYLCVFVFSEFIFVDWAICFQVQYVEDNLGVMSVGFLLASPSDAVIWRGPKKNGECNMK